MKEPLQIKKRGEDGSKIITVRIKEDTLAALDKIAAESNYSRNELINVILKYGVDNIEIIQTGKKVHAFAPSAVLKRKTKRGGYVAKEIKITKKQNRKGDDGYKIVSVRMKDEMLEQLDTLSAQTNRSRNELINLLLESAIKIVKVEE